MVDGYYQALQDGSSVDAFFFYYQPNVCIKTFLVPLGFRPVLCVCEKNIWSLAFVQSS